MLETAAVSPDVARAVRMADWLDGRFIDPVVGLVLPGAGDFAMSLAGLYPVFVAARHRMPAVVIARMLQNLAIDALVGAVPLLGDAFDFFWRAHRKNADLLLQRHVLGPSPLRDWAVVIAWLMALVLAIALPVALLVMVARRL